jgi:hypothetical protein
VLVRYSHGGTWKMSIYHSLESPSPGYKPR